MPAPTREAARWLAVCGWCAKRYATEDGWAWACKSCAPDALLESLAGVALELEQLANPQPTTDLCPHDGCLLLKGEQCPACRVRDRPDRNHRQTHYSDTEHDPKRPVAWVRKGHIQVPVYDQSEVA